MLEVLWIPANITDEPLKATVCVNSNLGVADLQERLAKVFGKGTNFLLARNHKKNQVLDLLRERETCGEVEEKRGEIVAYQRLQKEPVRRNPELLEVKIWQDKGASYNRPGSGKEMLTYSKLFVVDKLLTMLDVKKHIF